MHSRISEVLDYLDTQRAGLMAAVKTVPPALTSLRPSPDRWSAAQVVSHLGIVETSIAALIRQRLLEARAAGLGPDPDTSPILPTLDVARLLDRERALVAGERSRPPEAPIMDDAIATLERTRRILRGAIERADGLALGDVTAPHPLLGSLILYQWLVFLGAHEARHAAQIREIATALGVEPTSRT